MSREESNTSADGQGADIDGAPMSVADKNKVISVAAGGKPCDSGKSNEDAEAVAHQLRVAALEHEARKIGVANVDSAGMKYFIDHYTHLVKSWASKRVLAGVFRKRGNDIEDQAIADHLGTDRWAVTRCKNNADKDPLSSHALMRCWSRGLIVDEIGDSLEAIPEDERETFLAAANIERLNKSRKHLPPLDKDQYRWLSEICENAVVGIFGDGPEKTVEEIVSDIEEQVGISGLGELWEKWKDILPYVNLDTPEWGLQ